VRPARTRSVSTLASTDVVEIQPALRCGAAV
jgi:hypothetical protein